MSPPAAVSPAAPLLARLERSGVRLGLESFRRLLAALGDPQLACPTILVGGTNGKGSVSTLLGSIGDAGGLRTGLYTSPHLERPEERLRIEGAAIDGEELTRLLEEVVAAGERGGELPTYFEALTGCAFLHCARSGVELLVAEVGLGGRLDATNACEPELAVIAPIALDHEEYLGTTLESIAREKAGILRPDRPAVSWSSCDAVRGVLEAEAAARGTRLHVVEDEVRTGIVTPWDEGRQTIAIETPSASHELVVRMRGEHQRINLALAVRAAELMTPRFRVLDGTAIRTGAAACRWPGRLEEVATGDGRRLLLDGAHNPAGVETLCRELDRLGEPFDLLFGALADKATAAMLPPLAERASRVLLVAPESARAAPPQQLASLVEERRPQLAPDVPGGLAQLLDDGPPLKVVAGSFYLVGPVRRLLRERFGAPPPATEPLW